MKNIFSVALLSFLKSTNNEINNLTIRLVGAFFDNRVPVQYNWYTQICIWYAYDRLPLVVLEKRVNVFSC
jgi:hypothetical protein